MLSVFVNLIRNQVRMIQNPSDGVYIKRSAITEPPRKKKFETGARVIKKNKMPNATILFFLKLIIEKMPDAKKIIIPINAAGSLSV